MTRYLDLKAARGARYRAESRRLGLLPWWTPPDWPVLFAEALQRQPDEPRVPVGWQDLEAYEAWLATVGWYRCGLGPNQFLNGFSVFARPVDDVRWAA